MPQSKDPLASAKYCAKWLWLLLMLFCFRVTAQFFTIYKTAPGLPDFDAWHSAVIPYELLLIVQIIIIILLAFTAWRFSIGQINPQRRLGKVLWILGWVYFMVMLLRFLLGISLLANHAWFGKPLPALFHLVLASFLLIVASYHRRYAEKN